MEEKKLIEFRNIVKSFDTQVVLKGINLDIYENEFVTLLGPSGCGKTTLLRILGGFLDADEGKVIFDNEDITDKPPYERELNTVFQKYALFPHLSVYENIAFGLKLKKMSKDTLTHQLTETIEELSSAESLKGLFHQHRDGNPLPSGKALEEIISLSRSILFPGYFGNSSVNISTIKYHIGVRVEKLYEMLSEQILAGLCFANDCETETQAELQHQCAKAGVIAAKAIMEFPRLRKILATDVEAAYEGDPAAMSHGEIISCYPVIKAITNYRIAHVLHELGVPLIPRMMTELAHSETGIDINPEATIGKHFTIDHGTGVVIGATCIIGDNVKLYQGVTLGAKSFPLDKDGNPIKGIPRHPILENDVIVYANATILGRITIGEGCVVGANVWVTKDMKPKTKKYKKEKQSLLDIEFNNGTGI